jgi:4-amino-4-deoxy-L-arabinose transferase-like glycosyltransferase
MKAAETPIGGRSGLLLLLIVLAAAFGTRAWLFGDPVIQVDEQFYLLTGDRILHGAIPYVDIWDRKPVGIFLLYAAIRLLGGEGIYQYQLAAAFAAGLTAFLIATMALRFTNFRGAALAAVAYLLWLQIFDGGGGQTPVWYNPLMAGAGLLVMKAWCDDPSERALIGLGVGAMLLTGIAMQIKYSAVFEGLFFGLALTWRSWTLDRSRVRTAGRALSWSLVALLPTLAAMSWYWRAGHFDAFVYANFESIFLRTPASHGKLLLRVLGIIGLALPLLLCAITQVRPVGKAERDRSVRARHFAAAWLASALAGVAVFGTYFIHYFLPVLVPLTLLCAGMLGDRDAGVAIFAGGRRYRLSAAAFLIVSALGLTLLTVPKRLRTRGEDPQVRALATAIKTNMQGCLFVFDGDPILYHLTQACIPTTLAFPNHLNEQMEARAVGIDPRREVARILASEKVDIVVDSLPRDPGYNPATAAIVQRVIQANYRPIAVFPVGSHERIVYKRIHGPQGTAARPATGRIAMREDAGIVTPEP